MSVLQAEGFGIRDYPVVTGGGNGSTRRKRPPIPKSQATFSRPGLDSNPNSGERQLVVSGNALD